MTDKQKPSIETIVSYLKEQIPGCGISDSEIEAFKEIYPYVTYTKLEKYFTALSIKRRCNHSLI